MSLAIAELHGTDELVALTNDQLLDRFRKSLEITIGGLREAARCWAELERRPDIDLSTLRLNGPTVYLPAINAGTVLPEVVFALHGRPSLLKKVADLTPAEQTRLVLKAGTVEVVEKNPSDEDEPWTYRNLTLGQLLVRNELVKQVFGERCIRSRSEQIAYLSAPPPPWRPGKPVRRGRTAVDRDNGTVTIKGGEDSIKAVCEALKAAGITF